MKVTLATGQVTTAVGTFQGYDGDGGPATAASLDVPMSVAFDGGGNMYIADTGNHCIRMVAADTQTISTVAGPKTGAALSGLFTITVDAGGNIYVADTNYGLVGFIAAGSGTLQTIAGGGGGDGGPATQAQFFYPGLLTLDGLGNLYIPERSRIRKVDSTGLISTAAGGILSGFADGPAQSALIGLYPNGASLDAAGNIFIADTSNSVIRKVDHATGAITTVAGDLKNQCGRVSDGPALTVSLCTPTAVAVDKSGNLYIADNGNSRVRMVAAATGSLTTIGGTGGLDFAGDGGPATKANIVYPLCLWMDAVGNLFICDGGWNVIRRIDAASGTITTVAGVPGDGGMGDDGVPATKALLSSPGAVVEDAAGNLLIADSGNNRIVRVDAKSGVLTTIAGAGVDGYTGDGGPALNATFSFPDGLAVDGAGNIYVADYYNHRIRVLQPVQ